MKRKLLFAIGAFLCSVATWAQTDVTSTYLTNAGFDDCTAETSNVAAKTMKDYSSSGWTKTSSGSYTTIAVTAYGGGVKVANSTTPSTKKDGSTVSGNTLGIIAGWADDVKIQSGNITLPAGYYTLTVDHYLSSETNNYGTSRFGFVTASKEYLVSSTTFTSSTWTTESVSFTLTEETTGKIQIGVQGNNKTGSGAPAVFYDDITITWTDPNLAAARTKLGGYIKKATALNSVQSDATLGTAITTAQGVLDAATTSAECNDASDALSSAITTALSGATPVALANGNFDTTPNNTLDGEGNTIYSGTLSTATSNPDNTKDMSANTGDHGYLYDVTGWTQYSKFNNTAAQGTTSEYGTAMPANGWSTNSTTPPAADMLGESDGAALHLSAGWGDQARYQQTINELPSGRYLLYYEVINQHTNTGIASNYTGVSGAAGDFYGTTNAFVFSSLNSAATGEWIAQAFEFDVAKTADINFNVGFTTSTAGSGNGAKLWIDNYLVYRIGDVIVSEADANTIIANVEALDDAVYNATIKSALATAKSTFIGSKTLDNYNALNGALIAANESKSVYTALDAAITKVEGWTATTAAAGIRAKYNSGTYTNETTADDIYAEYQAAEIAALAAASATDYTSAIINPSFETGDMTGWSAESRYDTKVCPNSNVTYTTSGVDGSYLFNSWGGTAENNVSQTIKNLPAGTYTLSALLAGFNGESLVLAANETTNSITVTGDKTVGNTVHVVFTLADADDVVIKASNTKSQDGSDASFIKADNFRLTAGDVTTDDYTALNAAIDATNDKVLGFDEGEYAPYNNVEAIAALRAAKAVDQSVAMSQTDLDAIVNALTNATWTVNATEVNAFYDGNFTIQPEHTTGPTALTGWNNPEGIRQLIKNTTTYPGLTSATGQAAVFAWGNTTMTYGDTEGYTLPLKAHTIYEFSFKTCGWIDGDMGYVNVDIKNASNEGLQTVGTVTATKRINESEPWDEFKVFFETGEAGDYKFGMWTSKHTVFTDLQLVKAPEVTVNMNVKANKYGTFIAPFDVTIPSGIKAYTVENISGSVLGLTEVVTTIPANTPVILENTTEEVYNQDFTGASLAVEDSYTANYLTGVYTASTIAASDGSNTRYVLQTQGGVQAFYKVDAAFTATANRCYLTVPVASNSVKAFFFGFDDADAIRSIDNGQMTMENAEIFNLAGQRVNKAQKGIYIVNGKKVLVK